MANFWEINVKFPIAATLVLIRIPSNITYGPTKLFYIPAALHQDKKIVIVIQYHVLYLTHIGTKTIPVMDISQYKCLHSFQE